MHPIKHTRDLLSHAETICLDYATCHTHAQVTDAVYLEAELGSSQGAKQYEKQKEVTVNYYIQ